MNAFFFPSARLFRFSPAAITDFNILVDDEDLKGMVLWEIIVCMKKYYLGDIGEEGFTEDPYTSSLDYIENMLFEQRDDGSIDLDSPDDFLKIELRERLEETLSLMVTDGLTFPDNEDILHSIDEHYSGEFKWLLSDSGLLTLIY